MRGRFPPLVFLSALLALFCLGGCRTTAEISIDVDEAGAGQIAVAAELDAPAAQRVGDLTGLVAADDLRDAGWQISVSERRVLARKAVDSPDDLARAIGELGRPFSDLSFERRQTFARTSVALGGRVDLSGGVADFGDEELQRITGSVTGVDLPPDALSLSLRVDLPGEEATNAAGSTARWELPLGAVTPVEAESTDVNIVGLMGAGVAAASAVALLAVLVLSRRRP